MKPVYFFGPGIEEGHGKMKELLGGKGANLAEMGRLGLPVPYGFTITTEVCLEFYKNQQSLSEPVKEEVKKAMARLEQVTQKRFGDPHNPLLLSVRSGARQSMPGMMDTVLNIGLNDQVVEGLAAKTQNPRFAWDSYRRLIQMFSDVVLGVDHSHFELALEDKKRKKNVTQDADLSEGDWRELVTEYKKIVKREWGHDFPQAPWEQLWLAIQAVFQSWHGSRAVTYRNIHGIPHDWGTAVNVQSMVFGNMGNSSGTGVAFTRNPSTGEKEIYGEYLLNAQGEDVVAGIRTPEPISHLRDQMPAVYEQFVSLCHRLETYFKDMQDIEFTIENEKLWLLQTRTGKRTAKAALKIACDLVDEGIIPESEVLLRIDVKSLDQLLHPSIDPAAPRTLVAKGLGASPGGVSGRIVFTSEEAMDWAQKGEKVILLRLETSPEDIGGMHAAQGILTVRGGMTSHAAVVARGMGKCCVVGCSDLTLDEKSKTVRAGSHTLKEGDWITLDGSSGEVFLGVLPTKQPELSGEFERVMRMADQHARLKVRANADTPQDATQARRFGAVGIGLCRTEHMFFGEDRIDVVRRMIMAETTEERKEALAQLLPMQRDDFYHILKAMDPYPVCIRLLDPPLHEFIPHSPKDQQDYATRTGLSLKKVQERAVALHEFNPMLGHRGCRLAVTYPEIYEMQVQAIAEATAKLVKEGYNTAPEIMMPLVGSLSEMAYLRKLAESVVERVQKAQGVSFRYQVGTMIELPRAALVADELAREAEFFSFGTNDLTQTTLGLSRDDASRFLPEYLSKGIWPKDPFVSIDQQGVGALVSLACQKGRATRSAVKLGICGEHGGDPESIAFFHKAGLDYVSCSPFRVPIARLAAAQSALRH